MRALLSVASVLVICCAVLLALAAWSAPPTTKDIDGDLGRVREQIVAAETERLSYGKGLVVVLIDARLQALRTSEAFLMMKRDALLRRVSLQFVVEGKSVVTDPAKLAALERDIVSATEEVAAGELEADRYSGGLLQSLALARVATSRLTLAQLNLSLMAERHGLLLAWPTNDGKVAAPVSAPIGQSVVTHDGDAL